jgi:hypothetical protein
MVWPGPDPNRASTVPWWWGGVAVGQSWKSGLAALTGLVQALGARRRPRVAPLSEEWLREHEIEATKHQEG